MSVRLDGGIHSRMGYWAEEGDVAWVSREARPDRTAARRWFAAEANEPREWIEVHARAVYCRLCDWEGEPNSGVEECAADADGATPFWRLFW